MSIVTTYLTLLKGFLFHIKNKFNGLALLSFFFLENPINWALLAVNGVDSLFFILRPNNTHLDFTLSRTMLYIIKTTKTASTQTSNCACL